jgi:DNA-directed RNA polymerase sigma subunit (sigma70/sigma32)
MNDRSYSVRGVGDCETTMTDEEEKTATREELFHHNERYALKIANAHMRDFLDDDQKNLILSTALEGLWVATLKWDRTRGKRFCLYAHSYIKYYVWDLLEKWRLWRDSTTELTDTPFPTRDPFGDKRLYHNRVLEKLSDKNYVKHLLGKLSSDELREVVIAYHGIDDGIPKTFQEVSMVMGVSKQYVHQRYDRALREMRKLGNTL